MTMYGSNGLPTNAEVPTEALVDTSIAVPLVLADHEAHEDTLEAVHSIRLGLAGHAWFETYSVLTRLPPGSRRSPATILAILASDFPETRFLDADLAAALGVELARLDIAGGAVYDALIGATARAFRLPLLSRDRRARRTYESLGVDIRFLG
jgi:predicted nucleic acid-binding protein